MALLFSPSVDVGEKSIPTFPPVGWEVVGWEGIVVIQQKAPHVKTVRILAKDIIEGIDVSVTRDTMAKKGLVPLLNAVRDL